MKKSVLLLLFLAGCAAPNPWRYDSISAGDPLFDSAKLTYSPLTGYPPWKIEVLKMGGETEVHLCLMQYKFHPMAGDPSKIKVVLALEDRQVEETLPIFEGSMKLRLSDTLASTLIESLQDGKKVGILIDGFEETIDPDLFKNQFAKFDQSSRNWLNLQSPL
ncbi:MAG: hypothetical protein JSS32_05875 [Verrucomicrobia bacterium]|nr:hypothetical protein [Verrucomicrobiota bacterium]